MRSALRSRLGCDHDTTVALFVGGDWHHKGLAHAIDGVARAASAGRNLRLWVVGRGDQRTFKRLAASLGIGDRTHFLGPQTDVAPWYRAADVLLLPSSSETFGLVAYEAAASGVPVVATRVGAIPELVGDGAAGILVDRDADAIGVTVGRLADDPASRARMGVEGRRRALLRSWDTTAIEFQDVIRMVVEERSPMGTRARARA